MDNFGPETSLKREKALFDVEASGQSALSVLSSSELNALESRIKALDKLLTESVRAKYKLEVQFGKGRTVRGLPFVGMITYWLSGTKLDGGGDEKIFECPRCEAFIFPHQIQPGWRKNPDGTDYMTSMSICGKCGGVWTSDQTTGERLYRLTDRDWPHAILKVFRRLDMNADIYLKFHRTDIRYQTMLEMARDRGGEEVALARRNRGLHIYPLKNIINDTKNGAELYNRIRAFINA